jgi:hypothetical protein
MTVCLPATELISIDAMASVETPVILTGTVALNDQPTTPAPPVRPGTLRQAFRCPVCYGSPRCLRCLPLRCAA